MASTIDSGEFRRRCDNVQGIVQFAEDGVLLSCVAPVYEFPPPPLVTYFNEFTPLVEAEAVEQVRIEDTEANRLAVYLSIVYNGTSYDEWKSFTFRELREVYLSLDMYYLFPDSIMPRTPVPRNRPTGEPPFYRIPPDIAMRQRYLYGIEDATPNNGFIEIIHFGALNIEVPNPDPSIFIGTYYYRARGSGVAISVGPKTLIAWNKVHALRIMGVSDWDIYEESGKSFDNAVALAMATRNITEREAVSLVVNEMAQGKSIRLDRDTGRYVYFGIGDIGDNFMATRAVELGYTSIQLIREAQAAPNAPIAAVGFEFIDLKGPTESSASLLTDITVPL